MSTISTCKIDGMPEDHRLTASFGAAGRGQGEGYGKLFARTDAALYRAKADGRNRTVRDEDGSKRAVVTPINAESDRRREARG